MRRLYRMVLGRDATPREISAGLQFINGGGEAGVPANDLPPWRYGLGEYDATADRIKTFTPFRVFTDESWQGASMLPDPVTGKAALSADGGEPGDNPRQAVIRRWTSPDAGKLSIDGSLRHNQNSLGNSGDGVHARIISSRHGELAAWSVNGSNAETKLNGIKIEKGDTLDFVVDGREDTENDRFLWAPVIKLTPVDESAPKGNGWSAREDFRGPAPRPLTVWERYAHVLLQTNEFAFVD